MTLYAVTHDGGYEDEYYVFANRKDCDAYMDKVAADRYPRPTTLWFTPMMREPDGTQHPEKWQRFTAKGAKVRKPTVEEAHQDELNRMAYYNDMHMSAPCSGAVWMPPVRYEGF